MPRRKKARARRAAPKATAPKVTVPTTPNEFETWQATLSPREQRVEEVALMMAQGQWMVGASHQRLAKKWGIAPGTVEHIASEANRVLRRNFRSDDEGRLDATALVLQTFEVIRVRAMIAGSPSGLRVALEATEALGRYLGIEPPKRIAMTTKNEFADMTDEEVEALALGKTIDELMRDTLGDAQAAVAEERARAH